ncbi:sensor histidine kinase [Nostoc sp. UHCC 0926]|nr:sensor histidine kinase [Nostoc sp. UHCC 0926]WDD35371.1 sensor histidine kinase [Nostoc sp. UHCC 0926]
MGLSISYQIITEKHGGSLQCISSPGQGAEFVIAIPIRAGKSAQLSISDRHDRVTG